MELYFLFVAFWLLAPLTGLWPLVFQSPKKRGARNNPLCITIYPNDGSLQWRAVLAGEKVQYYTRWLGAVLIAAPIVLLISMNWMAASFLTFCCTLWASELVAICYRTNEYAGKVAYSLVKGLPVDSEAELLVNNYPEFSRMPVEAVARNLRRAAPVARLLVRLLRL